MLNCAIDLGFTRFDVAPSYGLGTAERVVGRVLAQRSQIVVSTKVGIEPPRIGYLMALLRQPYQMVRRINGNRLREYAPRIKASLELHSIDVERSILRSKTALRGVQIDAFLAHEALSKHSLANFIQATEREIDMGAIRSRGYSGERAALQWSAGYQALSDCVIQCSVRDAPYFADTGDLRLFGVVGVIAPEVEKLSRISIPYASDLRDSLKTRELGRRELFVAAVAAMCSLQTRASIIVATSNENTLSDALAGLQNTALRAWASTYAEVHAARLWSGTLGGAR